MKILYGYPAKEGYNNRVGLTDIRLSHIYRLQEYGFDVKPFNISQGLKSPVLKFKSLDKHWKYKDPNLIRLYNKFLEELDECDVFYNSVGVNFHPDFINSLNKFTIFGFNDDPESSEEQSIPISTAYDLCAIGNIAEVQTYKDRGIKNVFWQPMGFMPHMYNPTLTKTDILLNRREIDLSMVIDKKSKYRTARLNYIEKELPFGEFYGRGWKNGYLHSGKEVELYQNTKIGINIHNSTGPINTRLFYLPANGVLQICDNKSYLGQIFDLNKEVVGFDNIKEAVEKTRYYLSHDNERINIAVNGWKRVLKDYNEKEVFQRLITKIKETKSTKNTCNIPLGKQNFKDKIILHSFKIINKANEISKSAMNKFNR